MATRAAPPEPLPAILLGLLLVGFALSHIGGDADVPALAAIGLPDSAEIVYSISAPRIAMPTAAPQATLDFLRSYARGDEATVDQIASPLYKFEWLRRGLPAERRAMIAAPGRQPGDPFQERISFTYLGGAFDGLGFGHLLFAALPALPGRPATPSVFRIDVAPDGRVIWPELVWHFDRDTSAVRAVVNPGELASVPSPAGECCARLLFGVTSLDGREGYYAYTLEGGSPTWSDLSSISRPATIRFFAVDTDRQVRAGVWAYGEDVALPEYGRPKADPPAQQLGSEDAALWRVYLSTLD